MPSLALEVGNRQQEQLAIVSSIRESRQSTEADRKRDCGSGRDFKITGIGCVWGHPSALCFWETGFGVLRFNIYCDRFQSSLSPQYTSLSPDIFLRLRMLVLSCHTSNLQACNLFKQQLISESAFYESQANLRFLNFAVMLKRPWHCEDRITIFYVETSQISEGRDGLLQIGCSCIEA